MLKNTLNNKESMRLKKRPYIRHKTQNKITEEDLYKRQIELLNFMNT